MKKSAGILISVLGVVLLALAIMANIEFTEIATAAQGPELSNLSVPTKIVLRFLPPLEVTGGNGPSPADFAALVNRVLIGFGGGGLILLAFGVYLLLTGNGQNADSSVS